MRAELVDELEDFLRQGDLWDEGQVGGLVARLEQESELTGDPIPARLAAPYRSLLLRLRMGPVPRRLAFEVEGILIPRTWKVMEAARDGLPDAELRTRIQVLNRRLARRFAEEASAQAEAASSGEAGSAREGRS